ncbi:3-oxoacyl-[acyl-carrier protein] reductase [Chitinispirillum alkaliphilum]|nr:3-oxoacyl-[acyl-carrier protein] reductase [Chitinispirillum alkaliphilum]
MSSINEMLNLRNKVAVITGAAKGIGSAISRRFAEAGADLFLTDINSEELASIASQISNNFGCTVRTRVSDLSSPNSAKLLIEEALSTYSRVDILVNNAGIFPSTFTLDIEEGEWDRVLNTNLKSPYIASREFAKFLKSQKLPGVILNILSVSAITSAGNSTHYVASKHGLAGVTKSMASELGPFGIRCLALAPTMIDTPGLWASAEGSDEEIEELKSYGKSIPLGREGQPDEVATVALFAVSDLAKYLSGIIIPVDGGDLAR